MTSGGGIALLLEAVLEQSGYLAELRASHDPQDETRVENLAELVAVAQEFDERRALEGPASGAEPEDVGPAGALEEFLEQVSLVADADEVPDEPDAEAQGVVTLMTLHTAKGLEFPVVFLTGMEDGTFPHLRSLADPKELEEERRLAYVGITRARERLYLTRAAVRSAPGARRSTVRRRGSSTRSPATCSTGTGSGPPSPEPVARVSPRSRPWRLAPVCAVPAPGRSSHSSPETA